MNHNTPPTIIAQLHADLLQARKARDSLTTATLQTIIAAIDNAGAVTAPTDIETAGVGSTEVPRRELSTQDIQQIIYREITELQGALEDVGKVHNAYTEELHGKLAILKNYTS